MYKNYSAQGDIDISEEKAPFSFFSVQMCLQLRSAKYNNDESTNTLLFIFDFNCCSSIGCGDYHHGRHIVIVYLHVVFTLFGSIDASK